jgi:hypothetical protein
MVTDVCGRLFFSIYMQMVFDMQYTATRRSYDVVKILEMVYEKFIATVGQVFKSGVGHGLSATGLSLGIYHITTQFLQ